MAALMRDLSERLQRVQGVTGVTYSENGIFSGTESGTTAVVEGFAARADSDSALAYDDVGPRYFHTVGAQLLAGRDFEERDNETAPKVTVVNQTFARYYFANGNPIGRHVRADSATFEIIGVVRDIEENDLRSPPVRRLYFSMFQLKEMPTNARFEIATAGNPASVVAAVRRAMTAANPTLVVTSVDPLTSLLRESIAQDNLVARVVSVFGIVALLLAAIGLYGIMAYATLRRTSEFGLRLALGAESRDVLGLVLKEALALTLAGLAIGVPAALLALRLVRSQLFGVGLFDAPSMAVATAVLTVSAVVAAYVPARRASRVAPLVALRAES
jgi:predicted permease